MTTVLDSRRMGRKPVPARLALTFGGLACACAISTPAGAQDLGALRIDPLDDQVIESPAIVGSADQQPIVDETRGQGASAASATLRTGAIAPVQGGVAQETDPFSAVGMRIGGFVLRSTLDFGFSTQVENAHAESGSPSAVTQTTTRSLPADGALALQLDSEWDRHSVNLSLQGDVARDIEDGSTEIGMSAELGGRLDIGADTSLTGAVTYDYTPDDPQSAAFVAATDPSLVPAVSGVNDPVTQTFGGSLVLARDSALLFGEAGVEAAHELYGDAKLSDGSTISQSDLDNMVVDGRLRLGFHASPVFSPFAEASYGVRRMVETPDSGGLDRDATRYALRLGTEFDLGEKLNGEFAAGYAVEDVADTTLADLAGVSVAASVNWSPRRETDVRLGLETTTEVGGTAGEGGAMVYAAKMGVTHRARAYLTAEATLGVEHRLVAGGADETTVSATATFTHWFNRHLALVTQYGHERVFSTDPLQRSNTTTARMGLRVQR